MKRVNTFFLIILFIFLVAVSAYSKCHLVPAQADSRAGQGVRLSDCLQVYSANSNQVNLLRQFNEKILPLGALSGIESTVAVRLDFISLRYNVLPGRYHFLNPYLSLGVLRL